MSRKSAHQTVLDAVRGRKTGGQFGYGVTTADRYVRSLATCTEDACFRRFGTTDVASVLKEAENKLAFCSDENVVSETITDGNWKSSLPTNVYDRLQKEVTSSVAMVFKNVITTKREDRDRDVLWTGGAQPDPKMPLLWQHIHTLPLGKMLMVDEHTEDMLKAWTVLFDMNELTHDTAILVENDALRISHGFIPKQITDRQWQKDDPDERMPGFDIKVFEIMEESVVSVPSNVDAVIEAYASEKFKSPYVKNWGKALHDDRDKVWAGWSEADANDSKAGIGAESDPHLLDGLRILGGLDRPGQKSKANETCTCGTKSADSSDVTVQTNKDGSKERRRKGVYVEMKGSYEWVRSKLRPEIKDTIKNSTGLDDVSCYIEGTWSDHVIVEVYDWDTSEQTFWRVDYSYDEDGMPKPNGVPQEVELESGIKPKSAGDEEMKQSIKCRDGIKGLVTFLKSLALSDEDAKNLETHAGSLDLLMTENGKSPIWKQTEGGDEENPNEGGDSANPGVTEDNPVDDGNAQPTGEGEETVTPKSGDVELKDVMAFLASNEIPADKKAAVQQLVG